MINKEIEESINKLNNYNRSEKLNIDLHNHTLASDGYDSPLMQMFRAYRQELDVISITDHNTVDGYSILAKQIGDIVEYLENLDNKRDKSEEEKIKIKKGAKRFLNVLKKMKMIIGCEIVTTFKGCPYVEILSYGADLEKLAVELKRINNGLANQEEIINKRTKKMYKGQ